MKDLKGAVRDKGVGVPHILLIDDDQELLPAQVALAFPPPEHRITVAATGAAGLERVAADLPDVILLDLRLPDQQGLAVFDQVRAIDARIPVIFITASSTADSAIEAMKRGAFNYLQKPLDMQQLQVVVKEALEVAERMRSPVVLTESADEADVVGDGALLGVSPPMLEILKAIGRVAAQDVPVLITGESGTGKELVARAVYQHSARARAPFLALNCAAIPETLLESELFGHEKGAFTGADRRHIGKFEQCTGGTILLDEIGDMPLGLQAKILRILQEQTFQRVGGTEVVQTNVRVIASTHRDLRLLCAEGKFRHDLYYRLAVFTLDLPPLRDRGADLPLLSRHFVRRFAQEFGRDVREIGEEALGRLHAHKWPGNVRELQSVLKQALLRASGAVLLPGFLPDLTGGATRTSSPAPALDIERFIDEHLKSETTNLYAEVHRELDRVLLARVLTYTKGNHRHAARLLGISRQTVRVKLRAVNLHVTHDVALDDEPTSD